MLESQLVSHFQHRLQASGLPVNIRLWNGRMLKSGRTPHVTFDVRTPKVLPTLARPSMGKLARHYVEKEIDVSGTTRDILRIVEALSNDDPAAHTRARWHWLAHTRRADRKAIHQHYDVGDDFYRLWLDARRVYSCAYFRKSGDTLDQAQEQKLDLICRKLNLKTGERFLDIGCGWGALISWAAQHYGVHATGITLSENQYHYAQQRINKLGLAGRCEARLLDYRDMPEDEPFDKIASVGMFEHVGRENLSRYFGKIARLLREGGLVLNHGITLNSTQQAELGSGIGEFIDDYVFPGGELTHISKVIETMAQQELESRDVESLRPHYARTLWHWVDRLEAKRDAAIAVAGEKAYRIWRVYMAGSAHAFERGWLSIYQVLAGRQRADGSIDTPMTREHIYAAR